MRKRRNTLIIKYVQDGKKKKKLGVFYKRGLTYRTPLLVGSCEHKDANYSENFVFGGSFVSRFFLFFFAMIISATEALNCSDSNSSDLEAMPALIKSCSS